MKTPRIRGRPKKAEAGGRKKQGDVESSSVAVTVDEGSIDAKQIWRELMVFPVEMSEPYDILTRERGVVLMGKHFGLRYDCPDDVPLFQISSEIKVPKLLSVAEGEL